MKLINSGIHLNKIILKLILGHSFLIITIFGNLIIMSFSFTFYWIEANLNNSINSILDAIWWGFSTATTVGYGDIIPVTSGGKILGIILMLIGTALFATYTALFARAILEDEIIHSNFNVDQTEQDEFLEDLKEYRKQIDKSIKRYESLNKNK